MQITKEDFYQLRAESYSLDDQEVMVRYQNALNWLILKDGVVIRVVGLSGKAGAWE